MFDHRELFERQFQPHGDGYVLGANSRHGGRFVTAAEYERLRTNNRWLHEKILSWRLVVAALLLTILIAVVQTGFDLPGWTMTVLLYFLFAGLVAFVLWTALAPWRLARGRPMITPPKNLAEARKSARDAIPWPMVIIFLLFGAVALLTRLAQPEDSWSWWALVVGSGVLLAGYLAVAILKLGDRGR